MFHLYSEKEINVVLILTAQHLCTEQDLHYAAGIVGFERSELHMVLTNNQGEICSAVFEMLDTWRNDQEFNDVSVLQNKLLEMLEPSKKEDVLEKMEYLTTGKLPRQNLIK